MVLCDTILDELKYYTFYVYSYVYGYKLIATDKLVTVNINF